MPTVEDTPGMTNGFDIDAMRQRLLKSLKDKGLSQREVSLKSGNGPGYIHSITAEGKVPKVTNLAEVCDAAGLSLTYVMFGHEMSPELEELMSRVEAKPEKLASLLDLLK